MVILTIASNHFWIVHDLASICLSRATYFFLSAVRSLANLLSFLLQLFVLPPTYVFFLHLMFVPLQPTVCSSTSTCFSLHAVCHSIFVTECSGPEHFPPNRRSPARVPLNCLPAPAKYARSIHSQPNTPKEINKLNQPTPQNATKYRDRGKIQQMTAATATCTKLKLPMHSKIHQIIRPHGKRHPIAAPAAIPCKIDQIAAHHPHTRKVHQVTASATKYTKLQHTRQI